MMPIDKQTHALIHYILVSGRRGRSEDEIIAWGRAPLYNQIIADLEDEGKVYHAKHLFTGVRYYARRDCDGRH